MKKAIIKKCEWCNKEFIAKTKYVKTCSSKCSHLLAAKVCKEKGNGFKRIYNIDDYFLQKECNEKYYFLGLMAADGNISNTSISISQSGKEGKKCIEYIKKILNTNYPILKYKNKKGADSHGLNFRSKILQLELKKNNIIPQKTYKYIIPNYILQDENKLRYFLIGYIDGDGSIGVYSNMLVVSFVGTPLFIKQLQETKFLNFANYRKIKKSFINECRFCGMKAIKFCEWLYKDISVFKSYKYKKFKNYWDKRYELSPRLFTHERFEKINKYLDNNTNTTAKDICNIFKVNINYACHVLSKWRKRKSDK